MVLLFGALRMAPSGAAAHSAPAAYERCFTTLSGTTDELGSYRRHSAN